jgi:phosphoesterase RecJ-like protein
VYDEIKELIDANQEILIFGHKDADGDTLGCSLAFSEALRTAGKDVWVLIPPPLPQMYTFMPGFAEIRAEPPHGIDPQLVFFFDSGNLERSGESVKRIAAHATIVNVDHHPSNSRFGDVNVIDPDASAVGQMVMEMLDHFGYPITRAIAANLYVALLTDTGGFRHENTTEEALRLGAELVAAGCNPGWVALKSYKSRSVPQLKLEGLAVARLHTELDGRLIWSEITLGMLEEAGADMMESEGVIDQLQSIDTMAIAVLFKENSPGVTKVSVRTRDPYDATAVCRPFGGGGHHRAAGAELSEPLAVFEPRVLEVARGLLRSSR